MKHDVMQRRRRVKILRTSPLNWCPTNLVSQLKPSNNFCHITIHTCDYCNFLENKVDKYSSFPFLPFFTSLSFPLPVFFLSFPSFLPFFLISFGKFSVPTTLVSRQQGLQLKSLKSLLLRRWNDLTVKNSIT